MPNTIGTLARRWVSEESICNDTIKLQSAKDLQKLRYMAIPNSISDISFHADDLVPKIVSNELPLISIVNNKPTHIAVVMLRADTAYNLGVYMTLNASKGINKYYPQIALTLLNEHVNNSLEV